MDITINVKLEGPGIERAITLLAEAIGWQTMSASGSAGNTFMKTDAETHSGYDISMEVCKDAT